MIRLALAIVVIGTVIGAVMPDGPAQPAAPDAERVIVVASQPPSAPPVAQAAAFGEVRLRRFANGHFYADASVNGARIRFLVDTGATQISLTRADALRASIPLSPGMGEVIGMGAGGELRGEVVNLDRVELGHKQATGMTGLVINGGDQSLLGQAFLSKFDSVQIHGDEMVLR